MQAVVPVLILTGSMGAGKTTVMVAASELLSDAKIPHGAIDLDDFTNVYPSRDRFNTSFMFASLAAVWPIYAGAGATRLILAIVVEHKAGLERYREAIPGADITVCRLTAPVPVMQERVRQRDQVSPDWGVARSAELDAILVNSHVEDFTVDNGGGRHVTEVAREVLTKAGWPLA